MSQNVLQDLILQNVNDQVIPRTINFPKLEFKMLKTGSYPELPKIVEQSIGISK